MRTCSQIDGSKKKKKIREPLDISLSCYFSDIDIKYQSLSFEITLPILLFPFKPILITYYALLLDKSHPFCPKPFMLKLFLWQPMVPLRESYCEFICFYPLVNTRRYANLLPYYVCIQHPDRRSGQEQWLFVSTTLIKFSAV